LIGPSRKSFISKILGPETQGLCQGTLAACVIAAEQGASIVRVHDVKEVVRALKVLGAVQNANA